MTKQSRIAPFVRIVATDGKAYPLCPAGVPTVPAQGTPATPHGTPLANNLRAEGEAGGFSPVPSVSPTFPCPACEGTGFFTSGNFHPDDPRCEATWDCEDCQGSGEVDYETPSPRSTMTMEQVEAQIARVFNPLWKPKGWNRVEA